jgi:hypothetical protein
MEWIKVSDRLPKNDGNSSIYCIVFDKNIGVIVRPYNEYHECWDDEDGDDFYTEAIGGKITHWMELPKEP